MASNAENISIWWRHHDPMKYTHSFAVLFCYGFMVPAGLMWIIYPPIEKSGALNVMEFSDTRGAYIVQKTGSLFLLQITRPNPDLYTSCHFNAPTQRYWTLTNQSTEPPGHQRGWNYGSTALHSMSALTSKSPRITWNRLWNLLQLNCNL